MSSIIVEQKIFEEVRAWLQACTADHSNYFRRKICQLVNCMFCTGFWAGVFITCVAGFNLFQCGYFDFFLGGLLGGVCSYIGYLIVSLVENKLSLLGIKL